jgi:TonB family protein
MLFVDLAGVDLIAGTEDVPSQSAPPAAAPRTPAPATRMMVRAPRGPATVTPPAASEAANVQAAPAPSRFEISREAAPSEETAAAAADPSAASGQTAGAGEPGSAGPSGGASSVLRDGGGLAGSGGALLALAAPGEGRSSVPAEYGPYLARFRQRLQEVLVEPSGQIRSVRLLSSSSHAVLDAAALDTVRGLAPLPLPEHLPRRPLKIRLPVVFHLN